MADTDISWVRGRDGRAGLAWNPTSGCDIKSRGCDNCYAMKMARRLKAMGSPRYQMDGDPRTSGPGFGVQMHPSMLDWPLKRRAGRGIFVNSMSDLFHGKVTDQFVAQVFATMIASPQHIYYALTKRAPRMAKLLNSDAFWVLVAEHLARLWKVDHVAPLAAVPEWIWLGVSAEDQEQADRRIPLLQTVPVAAKGVRWVSCEPLLGPIDLTRISAGNAQQPDMVYDVVGKRYGVPGAWQAPMSAGLDWVVVGGESGHRNQARPMHPDWARSLRDQCLDIGGPGFYYKQDGSWSPDAPPGPLRPAHLYVNDVDGRTADEADALAQGGSWAGMWHKPGHGTDTLDGEVWQEWPATFTPEAVAA